MTESQTESQWKPLFFMDETDGICPPRVDWNRLTEPQTESL